MNASPQRGEVHQLSDQTRVRQGQRYPQVGFVMGIVRHSLVSARIFLEVGPIHGMNIYLYISIYIYMINSKEP